MEPAQLLLGRCIRTLREQRQLTLEQLANQAGISYQYLSGLETGKENFTIGVLENIARSLSLQVNVIVALAYQEGGALAAPRVNPAYFRSNVPLPDRLTAAHIEAAANTTQLIVHRINHHLHLETGKPLSEFIQGNNFSGIVSNIFCYALDAVSPYKHNSHTDYPDLICPEGNAGRGEGLEVKATINVGKGGESHNGHGGWHAVACFRRDPRGDIVFIHIMVARLNSHRDPNPDWKYQKSTVKSDSGSQRTETYITTLSGTTKLRDGTVYLDPTQVDFKRWREDRGGNPPPAWSIFTERPVKKRREKP
jgi:transcriptional regulator with XRE-family HTH domain